MDNFLRTRPNPNDNEQDLILERSNPYLIVSLHILSDLNEAISKYNGHCDSGGVTLFVLPRDLS